VKLLVFDFDGLILDTEVPEFQCWQEIYEAHGCQLELETWAHCIGTANVFDPWEHLAGQVGRPLDLAALQPSRQARMQELIAAQQVRPGVCTYLDEAAALGLKLGVASSSSRQWVAGHLARFGLVDRFHAIRCSDDVARVKPDPELYRSVCEHLGIDPAHAIAFEDSPNGILAAKRAGMTCVAVPNPLTARLDLSGADLRVDSLAEVPLSELLKRLAHEAD
jgi:HAD superfamily hydrolase (TIGR01509 family)